MTAFYKSPAQVMIRFEQDEDGDSPRPHDMSQKLDVETVFTPGDGHEDGNPERYWSITTERWAFNNLDELVAVLKKAGVE